MQSIIKELHNFVKFAAKELSLSKLPKIHFVGSKQDAKNAFGHSIGSDIYIRITDRHPGDVMRTIAHELIHVKQTQIGKTGEKFREDEANALAGRIMRKYNTTYPQIFKLKSIPANLRETESAIAANSLGDSSPTNPSSSIATFSPIMAVVQKRKKLTDLIGKTARLRELKKDRK
jgi:hypothetical protein